MSDQPITLEILGRIVRDLQLDVRDLKTRVAVLEIDMNGMKVALAQLANQLGESQQQILSVVGASEQKLLSVVAASEQRTAAALDELLASNQRLERLLAELIAKA